MDVPERQAIQDFREIEERFGLSVLSRRVGGLDLPVAEVERVDALVQQIYPGAVTLHGDAPVWMVTWPASLGLAEHLVVTACLPAHGFRGIRVIARVGNAPSRRAPLG